MFNLSKSNLFPFDIIKKVCIYQLRKSDFQLSKRILEKYAWNEENLYT